jgi:hypothetical protein
MPVKKPKPKPAGKWEDHPTGSYGVNRSFSRLADGTNAKMRMTSTVPVNICQMCKRVGGRLYDHKSKNMKLRICAECKAKF